MRYPKKPIKLHNTSSLVKVDRARERIVKSPDELIRLKIKKLEIDWVSGFEANIIKFEKLKSYKPNNHMSN